MSAQKLKEQGNMFFKDKKYRQANLKFKEAVALLEGKHAEELTKSDSPNCKLWVVLLTNSALCCLSLKEVQAYEQAVSACDKALKVDPDNLKGLYRRGLAYKQLGEMLEIADGKCTRLPTLYKQAKDDLEKLTLLDRKNEIAEQKLSQTIKNFYRVRLLAKNEQEQQINQSDERYKGKLSEHAEKKAQRQTAAMDKIMKEYKVDEVAKQARTKVEALLLEGDLPKTRTDLERAVKQLDKNRQALARFVLRLEVNNIAPLDPTFDTLYKLVMALADTPDLQKTHQAQLQKSLTAISQCKSFGLFCKSLIPSERKKLQQLCVRAFPDKNLLEQFTKLKLN